MFLIPLAFLTLVSDEQHPTEHVSPNIGSPLASFAKITGMLLVAGSTAAIGLFIILPDPTGLGAPSWAKYPVIAAVITG